MSANLRHLLSPLIQRGFGWKVGVSLLVIKKVISKIISLLFRENKKTSTIILINKGNIVINVKEIKVNVTSTK